jgi:hypothetical protein
MPLLRYFAFVGGALLMLLLISDAVLPQVPLPGAVRSASDLPVVRIHSERKWPERVVIDTTIPLPAASTIKIAKAEVAPPSPPQPGVSDASAKARMREAFAQLPHGQSDQPKAGAKVAAMAVGVPAKAEVKPQAKRRVARAQPPAGRPMMVAQQPHYGFFDSTW